MFAETKGGVKAIHVGEPELVGIEIAAIRAIGYELFGEGSEPGNSGRFDIVISGSIQVCCIGAADRIELFNDLYRQ
jgi:hypothetical protein